VHRLRQAKCCRRDSLRTPEGSFTVLYKYRQATAAQIADFKASLARAASVIPGSEITQEKAFGGTLYANIGTSLDLNQASQYTEALRAALKTNGLDGALVTGPPAIKSDVVPILASDLQRGQLIAIALALDFTHRGAWVFLGLC
jgi:hypothetical protein